MYFTSHVRIMFWATFLHKNHGSNGLFPPLSKGKEKNKKDGYSVGKIPYKNTQEKYSNYFKAGMRIRVDFIRIPILSSRKKNRIRPLKKINLDPDLRNKTGNPALKSLIFLETEVCLKKMKRRIFCPLPL